MTVVPLHITNLEKQVISKSFKERTGIRATYEINFKTDCSVDVIISSGISKPENISHQRLKNRTRSSLRILFEN